MMVVEEEATKEYEGTRGAIGGVKRGGKGVKGEG